MPRFPAWPLALVALSACTAEPEAPVVDTATATTTPLPTVAPSPVSIGPWEPCAALPGVDDDRAECAVAILPLDHDDPAGPTLEALVKRLPAEGPETGQVWVLHGGPGASAVDDLVGLMAGVPTARPDLGYYAVDHRGIGGTARLSCPEQEAPDTEEGTAVSAGEWDACLEHLVEVWGDDLDHLTTTASARDLGSLVEALAAPDEDVFVYGGSYGTYLGQRYLHLFPEQPTGAILDGIMPADASFVGYDQRMDEAARTLMDVCAADPACAAHFDGEDPWAVAERTVAALDDGHCQKLGISTDEARTILGYLTLYHPLRDLVPATVHRLDRCTFADAEALVGLIEGVFGGADPGGNDGAGRSNVLGMHVALSELWGLSDPPDVDEAEDEVDGLTMALGQTRTYASLVDRWPTFEADPWHGALPSYDGPLLMLQGELDSATQMPIVAPLAELYDAPGQTFASFPHGPHGLLVGTPMPEGDHCAERITLDFLDAPGADPDLSCISEVLPPDFDGDPLYALILFGSEDVWGDGAER